MVSFLKNHYALCIVLAQKNISFLFGSMVFKKAYQFEKVVLQKKSTYLCYKFDIICLDISAIDFERKHSYIIENGRESWH